MGGHSFIVERLARAASRGCVLQGPFAGMRYVSGSVGSVLSAKLVGTYERELHLAIDWILRDRPERVIDVGAAEGYYAVGLARVLPGAQVVAFESEQRGRELLRAMAALNGVGQRIEIEGHCTIESLSRALQPGPRTAVILDVEGAERDLLAGPVVPLLCGSPILVELHDWVVPGIGEMLQERFAATHEVERIVQEPRSDADWPADRVAWGSLVPRGFRRRCVDEKRAHRMEWLFLKPRGFRPS
jgi:hypothetical protein